MFKFIFLFVHSIKIQNIMKRTLLLSAVLLSSIATFSQTFESKASFWVKPNKIQNSKQVLNKNASITQNSDKSLTTNIGAGYSNFYLVFKSEDTDQKDLLNFTFTCTQQTLTTHNINHTGVVDIDQKRKTGAIVKYGFNYQHATGDKNFVTVSDVANDLTDIYEVIYVNEAFTDLDHQQIQTYLSLKYGISLINSANYVDANGRSIWDNNLNSMYNNNITGVGRSDYFNLNKLETINSVDKRIEISSNDFNNNEYLMIGSTNDHSNFVRVENQELLDSSWLVQTNATSNLTTLRFNLGSTLKTTGTYELLLNQNSSTFNTNDVLKIKGKVDGNQLVFENVMFDADGNGYDTFTIAHSTNSKEDAKPEMVINTKVNAYPNPANINETVNVTYNFNKPTNLNIHIFTVDGKLIDKHEINNVNNHVFETKFTSAGVYLIVSTYNGDITTNRIIVK